MFFGRLAGTLKKQIPRTVASSGTREGVLSGWGRPSAPGADVGAELRAPKRHHVTLHGPELQYGASAGGCSVVFVGRTRFVFVGCLFIVLVGPRVAHNLEMGPKLCDELRMAILREPFRSRGGQRFVIVVRWCLDSFNHHIQLVVVSHSTGCGLLYFKTYLIVYYFPNARMPNGLLLINTTCFVFGVTPLNRSRFVPLWSSLQGIV